MADRINEFSAMNCIAFIVLGIPMLVMLRKSRRIRLEMLYNNVTIIDDERRALSWQWFHWCLAFAVLFSRFWLSDGAWNCRHACFQNVKKGKAV